MQKRLLARFIFLAVAITASLYAWASAQWFVSSYYSHRANLDIAKSKRDRAQIAAFHALRTASWRLAGHHQSAIAAANSRDRAKHYRAALAQSPANAQLWFEWGRLQLLNDGPPSYASQSFARVNALAPSARNLQSAMAYLGQYYWFWGDQQAQDEWAKSYQFMFRYNGKKFRRHLVKSGNALTLCPVVGAKIGEEKWCQLAIEAMDRCKNPRGIRKWCRAMGAIP